MKKLMIVMIVALAIPLSAFAQSPVWDKSSVSLTGECQYTGTPPLAEAVFRVENVGADMAGETNWREYEGDQFRTGGWMILKAGEVREFRFAPEPVGAPVRFEVDQRPGHPGNSAPRLTLTCVPTAITLRTFSAASGAACWRGVVRAVHLRPGGWSIGVAPDRGGLLRWFWSTRLFNVGQRVTVCGSIVR